MLVAIFLPGALLVAAALPFWESLRRRPGVRNMVAGVNAAVVGILLSALYDPVWTSAIRGKWDFALALALFGLLVYARWSPLWVVLAAAAAVGRWAGWPDGQRPRGYCARRRRDAAPAVARPRRLAAYWRQRGARFCRKASMPSPASSSIMLRAMTSAAYS